MVAPEAMSPLVLVQAHAQCAAFVVPGFADVACETVFEEGGRRTAERDVRFEPKFVGEEAVDHFGADDLLVDCVGLDVFGLEVLGGRPRAAAPHGLGQATGAGR